MTALQYSGGYRGVLRVGGYPVSARRPDTTPQQRHPTRDDLTPSERLAYWHRKAARDWRVTGLVAPYNVILDGPEGERILFTDDTEWRLPDNGYVPLETEHSRTLLGQAKIHEQPAGLSIDAILPRERHHAAGTRRELSIGCTDLHTRRQPDGVYLVDSLQLNEVSLCQRAGWAPYTLATISLAA